MTNEPIYTPKFIEIRDNRQLNNHNLKHMLSLNDNFKNIINLTDPNEIAANLQLELNTVIDTLSQPNIIQYRKNYQPYFTSDIKTQTHQTTQLLNKAIQTNKFEDWMLYKNKRNTTQKRHKKS